MPMDISTRITSALMALSTLIFGYTLYLQITSTEDEKLRNGVATSVDAYTNIQKYFIDHPSLHPMYKSIYGDVNVDEYATSAILGQEIENVIEVTDCDTNVDQCRVDAWDYIFQQWITSSTFKKYWPRLRYEFTIRTQRYIDYLMDEHDRGSVLYPIP